MRRTLRNAALVNKRDWLEPSLDRLWRSLDKLFPLFRLLKAFWRSDSTYVLRGEVTERDWERFDYYAKRVKSFCYTRDPDSLDIAMHVYFRIAQLRKAPLLPSLRHLKCPHISQDDFLISSICLFLTPSLKILDFEKITGVEDKLIGTFVHTLLCEGARIESVRLVGEGLTRDTLGYLGRCVWLRSLVVSGMGRHVGVEVVRSLGRIPGLERLELDLEESGLLSVDGSEVIPASGASSWQEAQARVGLMLGVGGDGSGGASGGGGVGGSGSGEMVFENGGEEEELGFRELTTLEFVAPLSFVKTFLMQIGTTQLRHIGIESSREGVVDRRDLLACIVRRWRDTVTYIRMVHSAGGADADDDDNDNEETFAPKISIDTLSPLLSLTKLEHLEIENYRLELTGSDITDMANAPWAQTIHTLHLPFMGTGTQRPHVLSLDVLSRRFPELRYLTIPLDTTEFSVLPVEEWGRVSVHRLQTLTVASPDEPLELRRAMRLARVIDRMFPFLVKVRASEERTGGRWLQIHQMVKMCQSVRCEAVEILRNNTST